MVARSRMSGCTTAAPSSQAVAVERSPQDMAQAARRPWLQSAVADNKAAEVGPGHLPQVLVAERVALQPEEGRLRTARSCQRLCPSFLPGDEPRSAIKNHLFSNDEKSRGNSRSSTDVRLRTVVLSAGAIWAFSPTTVLCIVHCRPMGTQRPVSVSIFSTT